MAIILFDNSLRNHLYPLTLTRAVAGLRFGILTVQERWEKLTKTEVYVHTEKYLRALYKTAPMDEHLWIDASVLPDDELLDSILSLQRGDCLADEKGLIAGKATVQFSDFDALNALSFFETIRDHAGVNRLTYPWQMMLWNDGQLRKDFLTLTQNRTSQPIPETVHGIAPGSIFIEEGAKLNFCTINAGTGPVYIGKNAEIMEGSVIRGPFAICENAVLKMNSRVYGATTLGPYCMGAGEIKNSVLMGYSNKAHDGYLGDSVIGAWCNFGAGSSNSNLKNTAGEIKIWAMGEGEYVAVGQKCGLVMGDYSRVAINSSINTGSMIGVSANVFGAGLLPRFIESFSWGVTGTEYTLSNALRDIDNWKKLKGQAISEAETSVLTYIFEQLSNRTHS